MILRVGVIGNWSTIASFSGQLVAGDPVFHQKCAERRQVRCFGAGVELDPGAGLLAQHLVRHRGDGGHLDRGMGAQQVLYVLRIELHAAAVDDVLEPAGDGDEAVLVHVSQIART